MQVEFDSFSLLHIPRNGNAHVDSLAMLAISSAQDLPSHPRRVPAWTHRGKSRGSTGPPN